MQSILLATVTGLLASTALVSVASTPSKSVRMSQAKIVKEVVVAGATLLAVRPDLRTDSRIVERVATIGSAIRILDAMDDPETLDVLASLATYYLGESVGGIHRCLLVRKGLEVKERLLGILNDANENECAVRFGEWPERMRKVVCLDAPVYKSRIQGILKEIESNQLCEIF